MERILKTFILFLFVCFSSYAQNMNVVDGVIKLNPDSVYISNENEILVKFKNQTTITTKVGGPSRVASNISSIDKILGSYDFDKVEKLISKEALSKPIKVISSVSGNTIQINNLTQMYCLKVKKNSVKNATELINELKKLPEVEFVEPNYVFNILGNVETNLNNITNVNDETIINDSLYSTQWGIPTIGLDLLWKKPVIKTKRSVIAIIDTGVDIEHPDLKDNIWVNINEIPNDSIDNDGNGFIDDINGWDFVNQSNKIFDDNHHGTHCAGIAGAVGKNNIGIIGANPDALIMPVKVLKGDGTGDMATIIKGIDYAVNNGADIISMSFGGYAYSVALEEELAKAYQTTILVAAAGNDGLSLNDDCSRNTKTSARMYPGSFDFVLGVQATQQTFNTSTNSYLTYWSNYDCDGAFYSPFNSEKRYNYEVIAHGYKIISTIPGGKYALYSGTSMATPLVAGAISALQQRKDFSTQEELWGMLINPIVDNININTSFDYNMVPELNIVSVEENDTLDGDSDYMPDTNEIIDLYPTIMNNGLNVDSIFMSVKVDESCDNNLIEILSNNVSFGKPLSTYTKSKSVNPLRIKINENVIDGSSIKLIVTTWYGDNKDVVSQEMSLNIQNATELKGVLADNKTLYPTNNYIITDDLEIQNGTTLTIKPGTTIIVKKGKKIISNGNIICIGNSDSIITITKDKLDSYGGIINSGKYDVFKYSIIEYNDINVTQSWSSENGTSITDCVIRYTMNGINFDHIIFRNNNYINNNIPLSMRFYNDPYYNRNDSNYFYNNFVNNNVKYSKGILTNNEYLNNSNIFSNTGLDGKTIYSVQDINKSTTIVETNYPCYFGSSEDSIIRKNIYDFYTYGSDVYGVVDLSNKPSRPHKEAHGIVWKIVVDGYDSQDEMESLSALNISTHKFEVYFNRPMNKGIIPNISMGIEAPYTQTIINENGYWNDSGDVYTVYYTSDTSDNDGINRIYVSGAKDNENFEIPYENQRFNVLIQTDTENNGLTTNINNNDSKNIKIYPNPFNNDLRISFNDNFDKVNISITDLTGRIIDVINTNSFMSGGNEITWKPYNLSNGIYICIIKVNDKIVKTEKVMYLP